MGNDPIWLFGDGWEDGARSARLGGDGPLGCLLPRRCRWADLVPDFEHTRSSPRGLGEARGLDRVTAALNADRRLTVAYLPVQRP